MKKVILITESYTDGSASEAGLFDYDKLPLEIKNEVNKLILWEKLVL